jgi:hypothetical protein
VNGHSCVPSDKNIEPCTGNSNSNAGQDDDKPRANGVPNWGEHSSVTSARVFPFALCCLFPLPVDRTSVLVRDMFSRLVRIWGIYAGLK